MRARRMHWPPTLLMLTDLESKRRFLALRSELRRRLPRHNPTPLYPHKRGQHGRPRQFRLNCQPPLYGGMLTVTRSWAVGCFLPAYVRAREIVGDDQDEIVDWIVDILLPIHGNMAPTHASVELVRRIQLATAILLRSDGVDAAMPLEPIRGQSQPLPTSWGPPWIRALLSGWP